MRQKNQRALLAQVRSGLAFFPLFCHFPSCLHSLSRVSRPRRELRVCLRPVSLRPSLHFFISPDRFRARRLLQMKGTGSEVCGMEREAANTRAVCFSSGVWVSSKSVLCRRYFFFFAFCILRLICESARVSLLLPPYLLRCHTSYLQTLHSFDIFYSQLSYFIFLTFFSGFSRGCSSLLKP